MVDARVDAGGGDLAGQTVRACALGGWLVADYAKGVCRRW